MQRDMSLKPINIKNEGNYKEWRKLSIELISNPKDSYEPTSY